MMPHAVFKKCRSCMVYDSIRPGVVCIAQLMQCRCIYLPIVEN